MNKNWRVLITFLRLSSKLMWDLIFIFDTVNSSGKRANLKTGASRKQSTPNFPKNEHKKCSFFGKFGVLCFLEEPVLRFALLPYWYHYLDDYNIIKWKQTKELKRTYKISFSKSWLIKNYSTSMPPENLKTSGFLVEH